MVNVTDTTGLPDYFDTALVDRAAFKLGANLRESELLRDEQEALNVFTMSKTHTYGYRAPRRGRIR
jgi:hypothetical protein